MVSLFDMHVHTTAGSPDSGLDPEELLTECRRLGLSGALVAEHNGWARHEYDRFIANHDKDVVIIRAIEAYTNWGHCICIGMDQYVSGMNNVEILKKEADKVGAVIILAHPFRFLFDPAGVYTRNVLFEDPKTLPKTAIEAISHIVWKNVHEVEVVNGGNIEKENRFAQEVAKVLGWAGTGGSDAHSTAGLAKGMTAFHGDIRNERDLIDAIRARAMTPLENYHVGRTALYSDQNVEPIMPFLQSLDYYETSPVLSGPDYMP